MNHQKPLSTVFSLRSNKDKNLNYPPHQVESVLGLPPSYPSRSSNDKRMISSSKIPTKNTTKTRKKQRKITTVNFFDF